MNGVIYARYSAGPRQTDQSIEGQIADCEKYAAANDIKIVEIYADRHVSGKSTEGRDEFKRMITDAKKGKFECCIVWKIDRFGRDRRDIAIYKHELKKAGVKLLYAEESVPDGPEGIILESVLEGLAEYYSADLRQKVIRGIKETAKKGEYTQELPIGYTRDDQRHIILEETEAEAVREAFKMHIAGAKLSEIAEMFADRGIRGHRGSAISNGVIGRMLRNEHYTGKFEVQGIIIPAPAIVDQATFEEAARHFKTSRNNAAGNAKADFLLSCKCTCAYCGSILRGETGTSHTGKMYHYYKCGRKKSGHRCELKQLNRDKLEQLVYICTIEDCLSGPMVDLITKNILEIQEQEAATDPAESWRKILKSNQAKQRNLVNALALGNGNAPQQIMTMLQELENEAAELEAKIRHAEIKKPHLTAEAIKTWLYSFTYGDEDGNIVDDPAARKKLFDTFVKSVEVSNDEIHIFYNVPGSPEPRDRRSKRPGAKDEAAKSPENKEGSVGSPTELQVD